MSLRCLHDCNVYIEILIFQQLCLLRDGFTGLTVPKHPNFRKSKAGVFKKYLKRSSPEKFLEVKVQEKSNVLIFILNIFK